jgi:hypothetical protein
MQDGPKERLWILPFLAMCVFGVMVALLLRVVPGPHKELDYVVIGTVSIMVALLVVFLVWVRVGNSNAAAVRERTPEPKSETPRSGGGIFGDLSNGKA